VVSEVTLTVVGETRLPVQKDAAVNLGNAAARRASDSLEERPVSARGSHQVGDRVVCYPLPTPAEQRNALSAGDISTVGTPHLGEVFNDSLKSARSRHPGTPRVGDRGVFTEYATSAEQRNALSAKDFARGGQVLRMARGKDTGACSYRSIAKRPLTNPARRQG